MSKKPSHRKKARPAKPAVKSFLITVEAQPMRVRYEPNAFGDMAHFEYRSLHRPPRRIPVSETGYLSHFVSMEEVEAAKSPQDLAREEALYILRSHRPRSDGTNELPLF